MRFMDPTPPFAILEARDMLPWRSRRAFAKYVAFSGDRGNVFIKPGLLAMMRARAEQALPAETGGLLAGRVFRDERGAYSVVLNFGEAPPGAGGPGQFRVTPEGTYVLKERLAEIEPACDVVGWFHSHPSPMQYSATDFANQRLWSDPQHVGVLIFARGEEFGLVYQGPDAHLLPYRQQTPRAALKPMARKGIVEERRTAVSAPPPLGTQLAPSKAQGRHRTPASISLATLTLVLAVLVLQVLTLQTTKSERAPVAPSSPPRVVRSTAPSSEPTNSSAPGITSSFKSMPTEVASGPSWGTRPDGPLP